jgi:hypothetical protein
MHSHGFIKLFPQVHDYLNDECRLEDNRGRHGRPHEDTETAGIDAALGISAFGQTAK